MQVPPPKRPLASLTNFRDAKFHWRSIDALLLDLGHLHVGSTRGPLAKQTLSVGVACSHPPREGLNVTTLVVSSRLHGTVSHQGRLRVVSKPGPVTE